MYNTRKERSSISTNRCVKSKYVNDVVGFQHAKETSVGEKRDDNSITYIAHRNDAKQLERQKNIKLT
jgi:hypothetical protein